VLDAKHHSCNYLRCCYAVVANRMYVEALASTKSIIFRFELLLYKPYPFDGNCQIHIVYLYFNIYLIDKIIYTVDTQQNKYILKLF